MRDGARAYDARGDASNCQSTDFAVDCDDAYLSALEFSVIHGTIRVLAATCAAAGFSCTLLGMVTHRILQTEWSATNHEHLDVFSLLSPCFAPHPASTSSSAMLTYPNVMECFTIIDSLSTVVPRTAKFFYF